MANVAKIQAVLDLDSGNFHGKIRTAIGGLHNFGTAVDNTSKSLKNIERRVTGFGATVRDAMVTLGMFRASMLTLWAGTGQWVAAIIKANAELERMQALMRGVAKGTSAERNAAANRDLAYTIKLAQEAPFSISAIGDAVVKLRSAGLDAESTMKGLTNAVAAFGGNDETLKRATVALQQMAGKGVVSMEELRQQLGEAVPTAMALMAKGLGVSVAKLTKEVSKGTVEAKSAIAAMNNEMQAEYNGSAAAMMKTWVGMTAKLKTEWMLFAKQIGDAGLFQAAKDGLDQISKAMRDPATIQTAKSLGTALGSLLTTIGSFTKFLIDNQNAISTWGKAIATVIAGGYIISMVRGMSLWSTMLIGMQAQLKASTGATRNYWASFQGMSVMGRATVLAAGLKAGLNGLLTTLTGFSGPVGVAILAIGALLVWIAKLHFEAKATTATMVRLFSLKAGEFLSDEEMKTATGRLNDLGRATQSLNEAQALMADTARRRAAGQQVSSSANEALTRQLDAAANAIGVDEFMTDSVSFKSADERLNAMRKYLETRIPQQQAALQRSLANKNKFEADQFVFGNSERIGGAVKEAMAPYRKAEQELEIMAKEKNWTDEQMNNARNAILIKQTAAESTEYDRRISILQEKMGTMNDVSKQRTQSLIDDLKQKQMEANRLNNDLLAGRTAGIQTLGGKGKTEEEKNAAKTAAAQAKSFDSYVDGLRAKNAALQAQLEGMNPALAKFSSLLEGGKWGANPNTGLSAEAKKLLEANKALEKQIKDGKTLENMDQQLDEMAAKASADVISAQLKNSGDLYSKVASGMVGFNREVAVMRMELEKLGKPTKEFEDRVKAIEADLFKVDMTKFRDFVEETNMANNNATLTERARRIAEYNEQLRQYEILRTNLLAKAQTEGDKDEVNTKVDSMIKSETNRFTFETGNAWQKWMDQYRDSAQQMDDIWGNSLDGMLDGMTNFFTTGKSGWKDFLKDILTQITKMMLAKAIIQFISMIGQAWGGGGTTTVDSSANLGGANLGYTASANGNIMTDEGPLPLKKYAKGGIARTPQLSLFGEGRLPEAYVPLPDGRSIPVSMQGGGGGVQNNVSINISMADGTSTESGSGNPESKELGKMLSAAVKQVLANEMRPGGMIWKQQNGGK